MTFRLFFIFSMVLTAFIASQSIKGQIAAPTASLTVPAAYEPSDSIFLFTSIENSVLTFQTNEISGLTFEWLRYNSETNEWNTPVDNGTSASLTISESGGYQLTVTNTDAGTENIFRSWAFEPMLFDVVTSVVDEDCFSLTLKAENDSLPLVYYNPASAEAHYVDYNRTYIWVSDTEQEIEQGAITSMTAPLENTHFDVVITDLIGNSVNGALDYVALAVKADFIATTMQEKVPHEIHTQSDDPLTITVGSAPIEIRFQDASKGNVSQWEWRFGTVGLSAERNPFYVFTAQGTHEVNLRVINRISGCEDTGDTPLIVNVTNSELRAPNTFTPNGDGVNDEFRVVFSSLRKFHMTIYNQWGRIVYDSTNPSEGWDGSVNGSPAAPGVYFYYIEAEGYPRPNNQPSEKYKLKGPVHLVRGKQ
jgi:gliding motility-associated-like protein